MGMGPLDGSDLGSQERMVGIKVLVYTMAFQTERSQSHALVIGLGLHLFQADIDMAC